MATREPQPGDAGDRHRVEERKGQSADGEVAPVEGFGDPVLPRGQFEVGQGVAARDRGDVERVRAQPLEAELAQRVVPLDLVELEDPVLGEAWIERRVDELAVTRAPAASTRPQD